MAIPHEQQWLCCRIVSETFRNYTYPLLPSCTLTSSASLVALSLIPFLPSFLLPLWCGSIDTPSQTTSKCLPMTGRSVLLTWQLTSSASKVHAGDKWHLSHQYARVADAAAHCVKTALAVYVAVTGSLARAVRHSCAMSSRTLTALRCKPATDTLRLYPCG